MAEPTPTGSATSIPRSRSGSKTSRTSKTSRISKTPRESENVTPQMSNRSSKAKPSTSFNTEDTKANSLTIEYQDVLKEIENQNNTVNTLKLNIIDKALKPCKDHCEEKEIKDLRFILEREMIKLQGLLEKVVSLQAQDPTREWGEIELATTFQEDSYPLQLNTAAMMESCCPDLFNLTESQTCCECEKSRNVKALLKKLVKDLKQKRDPPMRKQNMKELAKALKCLKEVKCSCAKKKKKCNKIISDELKRCLCAQNKLSNCNLNLENDRFQLQNEVLNRDRTIDCLQEKINSSGKCPEPKLNSKIECLEKNIHGLENYLKQLKCEMKSLTNERNQMKCLIEKGNCGHQNINKEHPNPTCKSNNELEEMKDNYAYLMSEYAKKDSELKKLQQKMRKQNQNPADSSFYKNSPNGGTELELLRNKLCCLQDEIKEYKCLVKEQSEQLTDYQKKYLAAQQKVEEQKCIINKIDMSNKKIEDQINSEIQRIKNKFQDKLKELSKLLENEQIKLAKSCKKNEELENKLKLICRELKTMQDKEERSRNSNNPSNQNDQQVKDLECKIKDLCMENENLKKEKELLCDKLQKTIKELEMVRCESKKIIEGNKERYEHIRSCLQERINIIEKELAQCRATACMTISEREELTKDMKSQLLSLNCDLDRAQNHIKVLENRYMTTTGC